MDEDYFKKHLQKVKNKAGARYSPKLNIKLPLSEIFDGLVRSDIFYEQIREKYGELLREFRYISSEYEKKELQTEYEAVEKEIKIIFNLIERVKEYNTELIHWEEISSKSKEMEKSLWNFSDKLGEYKKIAPKPQKDPSKSGSYQKSPVEIIGSDINHIHKIRVLLRYFEETLLSNKYRLSNYPFLLLKGGAGSGKTHLLCDVCEHRIQKKLPTVLAFGEYFSNKKDFWSQLLVQLGVSRQFSSKTDFLKSLDQMGRDSKCRTILMIDALNENITHSPEFWKNNLNSLITELIKYPNIGLVVSVRDGFENEVLTKVQKNKFVMENHYGFRFREWEAVNKFFKEFDIPLPEIPLLMSEFQTPLFLLLFCKAFKKRKNKKKKQIFRGHEGATYIFENFTLNATEQIADEFNIKKGESKSPKYRIWEKVIKKVASEMVKKNDERIPEKKLIQIIEKSFLDINTGKFIQALETNMLIVRVPRYENGEKIGGFDIKFPFQKFSDHLIARYIFRNYEDEFKEKGKNINTAKKFFSKKRNLGKFLFNAWNRGIIEALSVQCPEQLKGVEFIEVAPYLLTQGNLAQLTIESFVESLVWRKPSAFTKDGKNTLKIINEYVFREYSGYDQLFNAFLSVAPIPIHPFNSERLHQHLIKMSLPNRDKSWSVFLSDQYKQQSSVDRILAWSWANQDKQHLKDDSVFLMVVALSWFLTTPNRFVRDRATKGLVCLLEHRIHLIPKLLEKFKSVNDPYIQERLFAVAYGCSLRNKKDHSNLKTLSEWIYKNIFKDDKPPVHILLRDYARGVIEVAMREDIKFKMNEKNIKPPHKSNWSQRIPTMETLKRKYYPDDFYKGKTKDRGFGSIWFSVMGGDFARYVIGTNSWSCEWSGRRLGFNNPNRKNLYDTFKNSLKGEQKSILEKSTNSFLGIKFVSYLAESENESDVEIKNREKEEKLRQKRLWSEFEESLSKKQLNYFKKEIKPYVSDRGIIDDPLETFDLKIAQRWIFNRVVKLGYDSKLHGEFDDRINRYSGMGRSSHKPERIGKKYQWIAYHEFMALVSDHFEFKKDSWRNSSKELYKGTWNPFIRDIDISFTQKDDDHIKENLSLKQWTSTYGSYDAWQKEKSDLNWVKNNSDLPNPLDIISITDDNKCDWLILTGALTWQEKTPPEHKRYDIPVRDVWYMFKSYIVKKGNAQLFLNWAKEQDFRGKRMPKSSEFYEAFLGEFPNSTAFEDLRGEYNIWTKVREFDEKHPMLVTVTDDCYLNEFTSDCSFNSGISMKLPSKWIVNKMKLTHNFLDGRFYDSKDDLIALPTSVFVENFPSVLLINKEAFIEFLDKNKYEVIWTLLGEKIIMGGTRDKYMNRLSISGSYTLNNKGNVKGNMHSKLTL